MSFNRTTKGFICGLAITAFGSVFVIPVFCFPSPGFLPAWPGWICNGASFVGVPIFWVGGLITAVLGIGNHITWTLIIGFIVNPLLGAILGNMIDRYWNRTANINLSAKCIVRSSRPALKGAIAGLLVTAIGAVLVSPLLFDQSPDHLVQRSIWLGIAAVYIAPYVFFFAALIWKSVGMESFWSLVCLGFIVNPALGALIGVLIGRWRSRMHRAGEGRKGHFSSR